MLKDTNNLKSAQNGWPKKIKTKKPQLSLRLAGVECTGCTSNRFEEDMAKIAIVDMPMVEAGSQQEPRPKADYQLISSQKIKAHKNLKSPKR